MAQLPESGTQYMSPDRLRSGLEECFGVGAISQFARISGISRSQISRYLNASCPVPKHVAWLVDLCVAVKRLQIWVDAMAGSTATLVKQVQEAKAVCFDTWCGDEVPRIWEESKSL